MVFEAGFIDPTRGSISYYRTIVKLWDALSMAYYSFIYGDYCICFSCIWLFTSAWRYLTVYIMSKKEIAKKTTTKTRSSKKSRLFILKYHIAAFSFAFVICGF